MSKKATMFAQITKVDAAKRLVYGTLAAETPDHSNEIMDYAASKAAFQSWTEKAAMATDGKSVGNMRSMHTSIAAGKFTEVTFDDVAKCVRVIGKVVDDAEWKKVQEGVYTGFSIGGAYAWKKKEGDLTRYSVGKIIEGSLVDAPCIPTAMIDSIKANNGYEFVKADGVSETRQFNLAGASFATKFRTAYALVKAQVVKIRTAVEEIASGGGLKKSMWDVADLACALASINRIRLYLKSEAAYEGDGSEVPERLRTWIDEGAVILGELLAEEAGELTQDAPLSDEMLTLSTRVDGLQKSLDGITALLSPPAPGSGDAAVESSTVVKGAPKTNNEVSTMDVKDKAAETDIAKSLAGALEKFESGLTKINERLEAQDAANKEISGAVETLAMIVAKIAGAPAPLKGVAPVAISKAGEAAITGGTLPGADGSANKVADGDDLHTSLKKSLHASNAQAVDPSDPRFPRR